MTSAAPGPGPADVVVLEALRAACGPVVALYRRFLDGGGVELDMGELDDALASMRRLPPMKGRMGKALALVASGGAQASTEEVIAALDLLSASPGLAAQALPLCRRWSAWRRSATSLSRACLPGLAAALRSGAGLRVPFRADGCPAETEASSGPDRLRRRRCGPCRPGCAGR